MTDSRDSKSVKPPHESSIPDDLRESPVTDTRETIPDDPNSLPYDDDPEWNASFAKSLDVLRRLTDKARKDYEEGRTIELNPDNYQA